MLAAEEGNTKIAVALLEKGAAMDVQDKVRWRGAVVLLSRKIVCAQIVRVDCFDRVCYVYAGVLLLACCCRFHLSLMWRPDLPCVRPCVCG